MLEIGKAPRQKNTGRQDKNKLIRDIAITCAVVIAVPIGVKLAYGWFVGQTAGRPLSVKYIKLADSGNTTDTKPTVAIRYLSSPVTPNTKGTLTVHTNPGANCSISIDYGKRAVPMSIGLAPKNADKTGAATWSWSVLSNTPTGTWPLTVTCTSQNNSARATQNLVVQDNS